jgi:hypothetical protein
MNGKELLLSSEINKYLKAASVGDVPDVGEAIVRYLNMDGWTFEPPKPKPYTGYKPTYSNKAD